MFRRRSLLQSLIAWLPLRSTRLWAQAVSFPGPQEATLKELSSTVLPTSLGRAQTDALAEQFVRWVREYRSGAEMQSGYGNTRVRYKPASPAGMYMEQLKQLATGALAQSDMRTRRKQISATLQAAGIQDLPQLPSGAHVVTDLMAFYFQSSEANDLAYAALIGKDKCRTLQDSRSVPATLGKAGS